MDTDFTIELNPLDDTFSIYTMEEGQEIPPQMLSSGFFSVTSTPDEISVVTNCEIDFPRIRSDKGWKGFKVDGILEFTMVGILCTIIEPLKAFGISVFVLSTFNTDYIFVKEKHFERAKEIFITSDNLSLRMK
ncbi:MAG TPA: ACT domain-containing protein [Prolixibacteraceae bacterium]|nr:ACT domain-containing protein [Prolixibacteraceae bacterium]